jgi:tRNA-splicing ligase RtcB (3'-phosphate/5'-hydroxy nucleic acid ligase)
MEVRGLIYSDQNMLKHILEEHAFEQVANVVFLPGIVKYSVAMPDINWGYGLPIGGVAVTDVNTGVISPGGVGFDINCGVRLLSTNLNEKEVSPQIGALMNSILHTIASGIGLAGKVRLRTGEIDEVLVKGARWAVEKGFGRPSNLETTEENGKIIGGDPVKVSQMAK